MQSSKIGWSNVCSSLALMGSLIIIIYSVYIIKSQEHEQVLEYVRAMSFCRITVCMGMFDIREV